ncbi:MAG: class I SAM-dependent methyltransferase [Methylotenera sp.]|nr:class I SAM-dependent methyltransferase [Oligoflexia bacterium]
MDNHEFERLLKEGSPQLSSDTRAKISSFRQLVIAENEVQNLTRLLSPVDFYEGHVLDAIELTKSGLVSYPAMDLGSGVGVPGMICALLAPGEWILCDSEVKKADFLMRAATDLGLYGSAVDVFAGRAEDYLKKNTVSSIVARAVGPVTRIYNWIRPCSTWNNLVLLKGPSWPQELSDFKESQRRSELSIEKTYEYTVGSLQKSRIIVRIIRGKITTV